MNSARPIRLAARAVIVHDARLLLVNAYGGRTDLWCAPGGGAEPHSSLPENLAREVHEETGIAVQIGAPCLINEFHDPERGFHQVDIFFRAEISGAVPQGNWVDPEGVVTHRRWVTQVEAAGLLIRPESLVDVAFCDSALSYDPLERILP